MKLGVGLLLLAALAVAGWLVFSGSGADDADPASAPATATTPLEAGRLGPGAEDLRREDAIPTEMTTPDRHEAAEEEAASSPAAWFRGRLLVVEGELPVAPLLSAVIFAAESPSSEDVTVRLTPGELSFEIPARAVISLCVLTLPEILRVVGVHGAATVSGHEVHFEAPTDGVIVDIAVIPHVGVLFLHDPSGAPLADAHAWHRVMDAGGSTTYGSTLGEDGLMIFNFESLANVGAAETVSFAVRHPPEIGYSESPSFAVKEFLLMPRPIVLRFGATERLNFRVLDPARSPIAGATVRIGDGGTSEASLEDGRVETLQSSPSAEDVVAEAPGYIEATLPITAAALGGQDLELWPASRLVLRATEKPPSGWSDLQAEIVFHGQEDASALLPERFQAGRFTENSGGTGVTSNRERMSYKLGTGFSEDGRVVVDGIHVDVPARVRVTYRGFTVLDERVPIQPGDGEHVVTVGPLPSRTRLHGRVVDPSGAPIAGVRCHAGDSFWGEEAQSGANGFFDLGEVAVGSVTQLRVAAPGFAPLRVEHLAEAGDTDSVGTLMLAQGRRVVVAMLDPDGAPCAPERRAGDPDWHPVLDVLGERMSPAEHPSVPLGPAEFLFTDLPEGIFPCHLRRGYREMEGEQTVSASSPRATITLTLSEWDWLNSPQ